MRRRSLPTEAMPDQLATFNPADWYVDDLEDDLEVDYARIRWSVARRAWAAGEDVTPYRQPAPWTQILQTRSQGRVPADYRRARPIELR